MTFGSMRVRTAVSTASCIFMIVSTACFALAGNSGKDNDWPGWRGSRLSGATVTDGTFRIDQDSGLKVAWKRDLGSGYSSVSIAGGHAVTMYSDGTFDYVISLDATSGGEEWQVKIDSTYGGHDGSHNGPLSTPLLEGDRVYTLTPKGELLVLDLTTGQTIWSTSLTKTHSAIAPFYGFTTSPLLHGDVLVVETGGPENTISGFDKKSGELLWKTGTDTVNYQSPITINIDGADQLVCVGDKYLYGLNPKDGKMFWEFHHNGGANSINPIFFDGNKLFFNQSGREFSLVEINNVDGSYSAKELWKTRHISGTLSTPVYHKGYIYGYNRRFLSCIDAVTGELKWKSRPPGDGFLILVDDYLVVQTKDGSLHVAAASSEGYTELASLQLFEKLTWTPPSFANGRIFARNLFEIASVDVIKMAGPVASHRADKPLGAPVSKFARFVKRVEAAQEKKKLIDDFMSSQATFPIIEDKKYAHVVYRGEAEDLAITGDMFEVNVEVPMHRIAGTDFYYYSFELAPDARVNYRFTKDFDQRIPDPMNKVKVPSFGGEVSQIAMPDWVHPRHLDEPAGGARGTLDSLNFESKILENARTVEVYLPPGYATSKARYPVVYVNYGKMAVRAAKMTNTLDNLTGNKIQPMIAVFIDAPNSFQEYARAGRDNYAKMVVEELVPFIDGKYRTQANADSRAFMGGDEGGYAAIYTAFKYPGHFSKLAGQSTHLLPSAGGDELVALVSRSAKLPVKFYLDWAEHDYINKIQEINWTEWNRSFASMLKEKGYAVTDLETHEGWGWASWRNRTDTILEGFFPLR